MKCSCIIPEVVKILYFLHLSVQKSAIESLGKDKKSRSPDLCQAVLMLRYCAVDK